MSVVFTGQEVFKMAENRDSATDGDRALPASPSPQQTVFDLLDIVSHIVAFLPHTKDVLNCRYLTRAFYAAGLPVAYKCIPLHLLDKIGPELKERYVRTVVAPPVKDCDPSVIQSVAPQTVLFKDPTFQDEELGVNGWTSVSGSETHTVVHFGSAYPSLVHQMLNCVYGLDRGADSGTVDTSPFPPADMPETTLTMVFVPPHISGQTDFGFLAYFDVAHARLIKIVGCESLEPLKVEGMAAPLTVKDAFLLYIRGFWADGPEPSEVYEDRLFKRIQFIDFQQHIEDTNEWKDVLDSRKVSEMLREHTEPMKTETDNDAE